MRTSTVVLRTALLLASAGTAAGQTGPASDPPPRIRTIVTTDGEADDRCSMIRFLLCANEWDIRGLIHSSSKHHWAGDGRHPGKKWADVGWLDRQLDRYAEVYPNLKLHAPNFPPVEELRQQVFVGNIALEGDMEKPTPGSQRIAEVLLDADSSVVWLQAWGGANTIARALKSIQEQHPGRMEAVKAKTRIFLVASQDTTTEDYILRQWPGIYLVRSTGAYAAIAYRWEQIMTRDEQRYFDRQWMTENILDGHGPLCAGYEARKDGAFRSEGDSPAFLHLLEVGLGGSQQPNLGGWGGRFEWAGNQWRSARDEGSVTKPILRWVRAIQNDWAARADWCVKNYRDANHAPRVLLAHPADVTAEPGTVVKLSARPSTDPDGDRLSYHWWPYAETGSYRGQITLQAAEGPEAAFTAPDDAVANESVHIVCEVTDDGSPPLTRYQRVRVNFREIPSR